MPAIALEDEIIELGHGKTHMRRSGDVLHPERESREALEAIKAEVGSLLFSGPISGSGRCRSKAPYPAVHGSAANARTSVVILTLVSHGRLY